MSIDSTVYFDLSTVAMSFRGYWANVDANGNVWNLFSTRQHPVPTLLSGTHNVSGHYYTLNGSKYRASYIRAMINTSAAFKKWKEVNALLQKKKLEDAAHSNSFTGSLLSAAKSTNDVKLIIGSETNGNLSFSNNPKIHRNWDSAKAEAERLARVNPGKRFVIFEMKSSVVAGGINWS